MATGHIVITSVIIILHQVTHCRAREFHQHICRKLVSAKNAIFTVSVNYLRMTIFWHDLHSFWQLFENDHRLACSWTLFFPVSDRTVIWGESRVAPPWQSSSIHILVWYSLVWYCMIWFGLVRCGMVWQLSAPTDLLIGQLPDDHHLNHLNAPLIARLPITSIR